MNELEALRALRLFIRRKGSLVPIRWTKGQVRRRNVNCALWRAHGWVLGIQGQAGKNSSFWLLNISECCGGCSVASPDSESVSWWHLCAGATEHERCRSVDQLQKVQQEWLEERKALKSEYREAVQLSVACGTRLTLFILLHTHDSVFSFDPSRPFLDSVEDLLNMLKGPLEFSAFTMGTGGQINDGGCVPPSSSHHRDLIGVSMH